MVELIRKDALSEELDNMVYNRQNADELYCEVKNLVHVMPTTTEAEIRAKVLQEAISKILPYGSLAAEWNDSMSKEEIAQEVIDQAKECFIDILEQLKEERGMAEIINITEKMRATEPVTNKFKLLTDRMKEYMDFLTEKAPTEDYEMWNEKLVRALKFLGDYKVDSEV